MPTGCANCPPITIPCGKRSEEHTSELQSLTNLVCRLLLEKKKKKKTPVRFSLRILRTIERRGTIPDALTRGVAIMLAHHGGSTTEAIDIERRSCCLCDNRELR